MDMIKLGRTGLMVSASSFGALPVQRVSMDEAKKLLRMAYDGGINYFDTANAYSDSEEKIGEALSDVRHNIIISTKSGALDKATLLKHIELSLRRLKTDYIDILQLHNPGTLPDPEDPDSLYGGLLEAQKKGWIRFIGITNHRNQLAWDAVLSGKYDTLQFPFSSISDEKDIALAELARDHDMGFIAMKGLAGGLITNARTTFAFMKQHPWVVPIWGIQRESELQEFLELEKNPPAYDEEMKQLIARDRAELAGNFCHGCGYCQPCPVGIPIQNAARMSLLLRRSPYQSWLTDEMNAEMMKIENCLHCGACASRCPYGLDTPRLLAENLADYKQFRAEHLNK
ncbi:MAG TPA: aldo/keto reductase [Candidatus Faecivivens stercorigallinarum]|nr:aldo/keto reductase [Candidatus Faecivivens stercorigallinarum]